MAGIFIIYMTIFAHILSYHHGYILRIRKFAAKTIIMKSYGRKIIDYIFKRWAERAAICYEPERKVQADSDRSDIRVFETGLSPQQYGDHRQSTRTAEEEECLRLIKIAKEQGFKLWMN